MTNRVGILGLILAAGMALIQPTAALAQDRYHRDGDFRDRGPRREEHIYRERERRGFRDEYRAPVRGGFEWRSNPYVDRSYSRGYVYSAPRYDGYYGPVRPYNCR